MDPARQIGQEAAARGAQRIPEQSPAVWCLRRRRLMARGSGLQRTRQTECVSAGRAESDGRLRYAPLR